MSPRYVTGTVLFDIVVYSIRIVGKDFPWPLAVILGRSSTCMDHREAQTS